FWIAGLDAAKSQQLADGLPILTTVFEKQGVRYTVEQFAYPLHGPPAERRGDIPMVLLQKIRLTDLLGAQRSVPLTLVERRQFPSYLTTEILEERRHRSATFRESAYHRTLLEISGVSGELPWNGTHDYQRAEKRFDTTLFATLEPHGSAEF